MDPATPGNDGSRAPRIHKAGVSTASPPCALNRARNHVGPGKLKRERRRPHIMPRPIHWHVKPLARSAQCMARTRALRPRAVNPPVPPANPRRQHTVCVCECACVCGVAPQHSHTAPPRTTNAWQRLGAGAPPRIPCSSAPWTAPSCAAGGLVRRRTSHGIAVGGHRPRLEGKVVEDLNLRTQECQRRCQQGCRWKPRPLEVRRIEVFLL